MGKIKVNTRYNQDRIENSVSFDNEEREYARNVIELQEKQTRAALIDLGWMPPEDAKSLTSKLDLEHRRRVAAEKTILEMRSLWVKDIDFEMGYDYKKWQSIIKEAEE
jgi:hypothetical protein